MAAAVKILYQKSGKNFKSTVFQITPSGNYPGDPGESVTLTSAASNASATTVTGPQGAPPVPPRMGASQLGGYKAELKDTGNGTFDLSFWNGDTELAAGAYPAVISGGVLTVEVDHDLQGF